MTKKIYWLDPHTLFPKHPPYQRLYHDGEQSDLTEVGMSCYLQVLPSIALYGFKYAIEINSSHEILNGDFRVFAARELGVKMPVVYSRLTEGRTMISYVIIKNLRRLLKKQSFFFKRFKNPDFKFDKVPLLCLFQRPLFGEVYPNRTDVGDYPSPKRKTTTEKIKTIINYYLKRELI